MFLVMITISLCVLRQYETNSKTSTLSGECDIYRKSSLKATTMDTEESNDRDLMSAVQ